MILKEAFQYQNYLSNLINEAQGYLLKGDFITTKSEVHNRRKVNPDAEDETVDVKSNCNVDFTPMQLINFVVSAIEEKQKLSDAISIAKSKVDFDIDSAIAMNKVKQNCIHMLSYMREHKSSEVEKKGTAYKFDVNGEQKPYYYPITEITSINYDREDVKNLIKKYQKETEAVSAKKDFLDVTVEVNYTPRENWELNSTLEDVLSA